MHKLTSALCLLALIGWAASAHAGTVTQTYTVQNVPNSTGKTVDRKFAFAPFNATSVTGGLTLVFTTANSTFEKSDTIPPSVSIHMTNFSANAKGQRGGFVWTITGSIMAKAAGTTVCHVNSHTASSNAIIAASCNAKGFAVTTRAHCSGNCNAFSAPGCWGATPNSSTHTQMWTTGTVHLGQGTFSHKTGSAHYLKSFQATLSPPIAHNCSSNQGPHLASSGSGYHTMHISAKLNSSGG